MKFLSTHEEACAYLEISTQLPDVSGYPEEKQVRLNADEILERILKANNKIANNGISWKANVADTTQEKWYPVFDVIQDTSCSGGFRLSFSGCDYDRSSACLGARHACKTRSLALFMGENCTDIYHDTLS